MIYDKWMSYIKDDALLKNIAIPGSHDSGTYEMMRFARCQGGNLFEQYMHGVRYFDLRFHVGKKGKLVFEHGVLGGTEFEKGLADIKKMIEHNDSEFLIFYLHYPTEEYLVGKIGRHYRQDFPYVNEVFKKYINPDVYAFTDEEKIQSITIQEIRQSGKRYLMLWDNDGIDGAVKAKLYAPWNPTVHGLKIDDFHNESLKFFDSVPDDAIFCYQSQRTPGIGTKEGLKNPDTLEKVTKANFHKLIKRISEDENLLNKVNIISGDFMSDDYSKSSEIISLNLPKNNVDEKYTELFSKEIAL